MLRKSVVLGRLAVVLTACATSPTGRKQSMLVSGQQAIAASRQACVQEMGRYPQAGKALPAFLGTHPSDQQRRQRPAAWSA